MKKTIKDLDIYISDGNYSSKYPRSEEFVEEGIPFIRGNNMVDGDISDDEMYYITPEKHAILLKGHVKAGDVLITTRGNIGQVAIVPERHEDSNINAQIVLLRTNPESLYNRYLLWALQSHRANEQYMALQTGTALKQLPVGKLEKLSIKVADIDEQHDIANTLDKVYEVIKERRKELLLLDDLIKARFVEMFGDPVVHLDKGETVRLDTLAEKITVGFVGEASNEYVDEGVPYLRTQNVRVNRIDLDGLIYVNEKFHNKNQKSIIHPGDVVISRVGVNRGMAAMVPDTLPEANIANCLIVGQTDNINSYYLAFYMNMSFGKRPQFGASVGSAQGVVNTSILKKWEVFVPDRILQDEFYEFAKQVDKSKVVVQKALDEAQLLFDSLMQQYFG